MTEKQTKVVTGNVELVSTTKGYVKLSDGKFYGNKFYKGNWPNKGDSVEITLEQNGEYWNVKSIAVKTSAPTKQDAVDNRINVDAGNCLQRATELTIAGKGNKTLLATALEVVAAFKAAKMELERAIEPQAENPGETQGPAVYDENGVML